jgi:glycerophosphoryl diester phosphodiesterase
VDGLSGVPHRYAYLDAALPIPFAHRGGGVAGAENTLVAFAQAAERGYRYLETDVRATADGVAVVFHDATLSRILDRPGAVAKLTWADLATIRVNGAAVVPPLTDLLDALPGHRFNIDIKSDGAVDPTIEAIWRTAARDRVLLASFSDKRIRWVRRVCGPRQATSLGLREVARLRLGSLHGRALAGFVPGVPAVQLPIRVGGVRLLDRRLVAHAHRLGMQVHVWTVNDIADMHELLDLGVDGIMTDHIETLRTVLTERGQWNP